MNGLTVKKRLLFLLGSLLLACVLVEGLARVFFPEWAPRTALITKFWRYDPRYGWSHIPGATGLFKTFGIDTVVSINRKGFRGPEVSYARENGDKRVLVLGDSLVWGFGVNYEDIFTTQMETFVPNTQIVNLGVSGYSTDQELLLYQYEGRKYRPDIVVVVVAANDRAGNERDVEYFIYGKPRFIVRNGNLELTNNPVKKISWMKRAAVWLTWRSFVLTQLHRAIYQAGATGAMAAEKLREPEYGDITDSHGINHRRTPAAAAWVMTLRLLVEMKRTIEKDRAELLVVFSDGIGTAAVRNVGAFLKSSQIKAIFLDEYVNASDPSLHLPDQVHWSPAGNKIVASVVAKELKETMAGLP